MASYICIYTHIYIITGRTWQATYVYTHIYIIAGQTWQATFVYTHIYSHWSNMASFLGNAIQRMLFPAHGAFLHAGRCQFPSVPAAVTVHGHVITP
jgi:hypothetical protein